MKWKSRIKEKVADGLLLGAAALVLVVLEYERFLKKVRGGYSSRPVDRNGDGE